MHYFLMRQNPHKLQRNTLVYDLLIEDGGCWCKGSCNYKPCNKSMLKMGWINLLRLGGWWGFFDYSSLLSYQEAS